MLRGGESAPHEAVLESVYEVQVSSGYWIVPLLLVTEASSGAVAQLEGEVEGDVAMGQPTAAR